MRQYSFKERFCLVHQCPPEDFVERVFRLCLPRRARLLAGSARPGASSFFDWGWDFECINAVANVTSNLGAVAELNLYVYLHPPLGPLKGWLRVRVSDRRLMYLIEEVFAASGSAPLPAHSALPEAGTDP